MSNFGDLLKKARITAKLSQQGLGKEAGYSQNAISKMESGGSDRPRNLESLAKALNVPVSYFLLHEDEGAIPNPDTTFSQRLIQAMLDKGYHSSRRSASGVDAAPLAKTCGVSTEMARRYLVSGAMPDSEKLPVIANWLGVDFNWLVFGDEAAKPNKGYSAQSAAVNFVSSNLAFLIDTQGLTISGLSYDSGLPESTINSLLKGDLKEPRVSILRALAQSLGITHYSTLTDTDLSANPSEINESDNNYTYSTEAFSVNDMMALRKAIEEAMDSLQMLGDEVSTPDVISRAAAAIFLKSRNKNVKGVNEACLAAIDSPIAMVD